MLFSFQTYRSRDKNVTINTVLTIQDFSDDNVLG